MGCGRTGIPPRRKKHLTFPFFFRIIQHRIKRTPTPEPMSKRFFVVSTSFVAFIVFIVLFAEYEITLLLASAIGALCVSVHNAYDPFKYRPDRLHKLQNQMYRDEPDPIFENEAWEEWNERMHGSLKQADKEWKALHSHVRH